MPSLIFAIALAIASAPADGTTLQERIDAAAPNDTLRVEAGVHTGPIVISKPLTLIGEHGAEIRGNGRGKVVTIAADDVTLSGLRITGSGLQLSDETPQFSSPAIAPRSKITSSPIRSTAFISRKSPARRFSITTFREKQR